MANVRIVMPPVRMETACLRHATGHIPAGYLTSIPPVPRSVRIELTSRPAEGGEMRWPLFTQLVGELADAGLINGQRVVPARALSLGFQFKYTSIDAALGAAVRAG